MKRAAISFVCLAVASCSSITQKTAATPPHTRTNPVTEVLHGENLIDNYRWLEGDLADSRQPGKTTPEVAAWTDEQNAYARSVLDNLPGRRTLEKRLQSSMDIGSVTSPIMRGNRYFFALRSAQRNQPIIYKREGALGVDRVVVDPNQLDPSGNTAVSWFSPSHDGKLLAYGTYREGEQGTTMHVVDVETATLQRIEIGDIASGAQWLPDGSGFVYERQTNPQDANGREGLLHRLGTDPSTDVVVYRQFSSGALSSDGRRLLLARWRDRASTDLWLADFELFRKEQKLSAIKVTGGDKGETFGTLVGDRLFLQTTTGAPNGRVVSAGIEEPDQPNWRVVVPERADAVIQAVAFGLETIAVTYLKDSSNLVEVFDFNGRPLGTLKQPGLGTVSLMAAQDRTEAYLTFTSFNYPPSVFRVDLRKPAASPTLWLGPDISFEPSSVETEQVWYSSKDGTRINMFLVHKKGLARTPNTPTLLGAQGTLALGSAPTFSPALTYWFEDGAMLAAPNPRADDRHGGGWHRSVDDFIAAAEWLVANNYTSSKKLAVYGFADGGLVAGTALVNRPELFRAIVMDDPLLDMLRYDKFANEPELISEYGTASDQAQFKRLLADSPYQRVRSGTDYPAVLLTATEGAAAVHAFHARKMTAALQASTASNIAEQPILLSVDRRGSDEDRSQSLDLNLRRLVDQRIFLMWQLGML